MKIKYSPCKWNPNAAASLPSGTLPDTVIEYVDENTITIDGEPQEFPIDAVAFPGIAEASEGRILEARRESGELLLGARRFYTRSCAAWDTGDYQAIGPGAAP